MSMWWSRTPQCSIDYVHTLEVTSELAVLKHVLTSKRNCMQSKLVESSCHGWPLDRVVKGSSMGVLVQSASSSSRMKDGRRLEDAVLESRRSLVRSTAKSTPKPNPTCPQKASLARRLSGVRIDAKDYQNQKIILCRPSFVFFSEPSASHLFVPSMRHGIISKVRRRWRDRPPSGQRSTAGFRKAA